MTSIKKEIEKTPEIIGKSMSIIPSNCLVRLARINCRKVQNILLLMKVKVISV